MTEPLVALQSLLARESRAPGVRHGDELSPEGLRALTAGGAPEGMSHALLDFWADVSHRVIDDRGTLVLGLVRTAELWTSLGSQHTNRAALDALDRAFATMYENLGDFRNRIGQDTMRVFADALATHARHASSLLSDVTLPHRTWVILANSVVALAPQTFSTAFEPLVTVTPAYWRATTQYLAALSYQTVDHPTTKDPFILWDRFGVQDGVRWSTAPARALANVLDIERVRHIMIDGLLELVNTGVIHEPEASTVRLWMREILDIQLAIDFPRRRGIVVAKLLEENPPRFWDDELDVQPATKDAPD